MDDLLFPAGNFVFWEYSIHLYFSFKPEGEVFHSPGVPCKNERGQKQNRENSKPPCFPEWRSNYYFYGCIFIIPHAVIVGTPDPKDIFPGVQIGKSNIMFVTQMNPIVIKPLHHIHVLIFFRVCIIQCRKYEGENVIFVRKYNFVSFGNMLLQRRPLTVDDGFIEYLKRCLL